MFEIMDNQKSGAVIKVIGVGGGDGVSTAVGGGKAERAIAQRLA